jgi:hypothetical protein
MKIQKNPEKPMLPTFIPVDAETLKFHPMHTEHQIEQANKIVAWYTLAAAATGALPVPGASGAIVAENGIMISHVASAMGTPISVFTVVESIGFAGSLNIVGRNLFIGGAKLLSWGTGSVWALALLSSLGAATAGLQTYIIGRIAIEIGKHGGSILPDSTVVQLIADCKRTYDGFVKHWSTRKLVKPA